MSRVFDDGEDEIEDEHIESISIINALSEQLGEDGNGDRIQGIDLDMERERIYDELSEIIEEKSALAKVSYGELEKTLYSTEVKVERLAAELARNEAELEQLQTHLKSAEVVMECAETSGREACENLLLAEEKLDGAEETYHQQLAALRKEIEFQQNQITAMTEAHATEIKRIIEEREEKLENGPPLKRKQASTAPPGTIAGMISGAATAESKIEGTAVVLPDDGELEKEHENGEPRKM